MIILLVLKIGRSDDFGEEASTPTTDENGRTVETIDQSTTADPSITVTEATKDTPTTYGLSETTTDLTINEVPNDVAITTTEGTISSFSMTNALFSLGSLIQGSFISFSNNNNIYFKSLFDASTFTATLDNGSSLQVGQRSSFGDLGKVVIQIDGSGNLTQDNSITFTPDSNTATYTYYNTTEIEFQDGNVSLLGESITNKDAKQASTAFFNENGFTKIQLQPKNSYTIFDYSIANTGDTPLIICKKNPLCDINIDESTFTIKGETNFTENGGTVYQSNDENNIFTIDTATGIASLENRNPSTGTLALLFSGQFQINETADTTYYKPLEQGVAFSITQYQSFNEQEPIFLKQGVLTTGQHASFTTDYSSYTDCVKNICVYPQEINTTRIQAPQLPSQSALWPIGALVVLTALYLIFFKKEKRKSKKGQLTLFIVLGILLIIIATLFFILFQQQSTATDITEIKSIEQARSAVESCMTETIQNDIQAFGAHGGYINADPYTFSSFNTSYDLLSMNELEANLQTGMERSLSACRSVLENTPYKVTSTGRISINASFGEELDITGSSWGVVSDQTGKESEVISEIKQSESINLPEIYSLVQDLEADNWTPLIINKRYLIRTFYNEDLSEQLVQITDSTSGFVFQITKKRV